jgi:hypothetical protein
MTRKLSVTRSQKTAQFARDVFARETEDRIGEFGQLAYHLLPLRRPRSVLAKARIDLPVEQVDDVPEPCVLHFAGRHWRSLVAHLQRTPACWGAA